MEKCIHGLLHRKSAHTRLMHELLHREVANDSRAVPMDNRAYCAIAKSFKNRSNFLNFYDELLNHTMCLLSGKYGAGVEGEGTRDDGPSGSPKPAYYPSIAE